MIKADPRDILALDEVERGVDVVGVVLVDREIVELIKPVIECYHYFSFFIDEDQDHYSNFQEFLVGDDCEPVKFVL